MTTDTNLTHRYDQWHAQHVTGEPDEPWYGLVWEAIQRRELIRNARVLEIGCGRGHFALKLAQHGASLVVGQDFSETAIRNAPSHELPNLRFETGDIMSIAYPEESFDLVVSCETLEHVATPRRAVAELARILRPGGTLLLTTPNYLSITGAHRAFREATGRRWDEGGQPLCHWTNLPRTVAWLRSSGFIVNSIDGDGWIVPIPRRPGGYQLRPRGALRRALKPFAVHQLVEATLPA